MASQLQCNLKKVCKIQCKCEFLYAKINSKIAAAVHVATSHGDGIYIPHFLYTYSNAVYIISVQG